MKFTNSPFTILDKNMNALDYQKRNIINEDSWGRENDNQTKEDYISYLFIFFWLYCLDYYLLSIGIW